MLASSPHVTLFVTLDEYLTCDRPPHQDHTTPFPSARLHMNLGGCMIGPSTRMHPRSFLVQFRMLLLPLRLVHTGAGLESLMPSRCAKFFEPLCTIEKAIGTNCEEMPAKNFLRSTSQLLPFFALQSY